MEQTDAKINIDINEKLKLRSPSIDDSSVLYALIDRNRSHLGEFLNWVDDVQSPQDTELFLKNEITKNQKLESLFLLIMYEGEIVGVVGFNTIDAANHLAVVGYWIDKDHQGLGMMTQSLSALIDYSKKRFDLHRIEIRCAVNNTKSQLIPERLGFVKEGLLKEALFLHGKFFDVISYGKII